MFTYWTHPDLYLHPDLEFWTQFIFILMAIERKQLDVLYVFMSIEKAIWALMETVLV